MNKKTVPYSYDLRTKVMRAIDDGMGKNQASRLFKITKNTLILWSKYIKKNSK
ncbi:IS630 transposase-related protein [Moorena producens]|uniref:IS630 transposase-related protein n=1 Tax=Moorena producens TaxID=1155739 RepID=UPI0022773498|nr:IS630 transposase-related protein [Moorena producens]